MDRRPSSEPVAPIRRLVVLAACSLVVSVSAPVLAAPVSATASLSVSESYDNNVYLSETDPIGDVITTVSPRVDLLFDEETVEGALRYQASAEWYRQRRQEDRLSQRGELDAAVHAVRRLVPGLNLHVGGSYSLAGELPWTALADRPPDPADGVELPRTKTTRWRGSLTAGYRWTGRVDTLLEYAYATTRREAFDVAALADVVGTTPALTLVTHDSVVHDATLAWRYRFSPVTTLTLNPGWTSTRVEPTEDAVDTGRVTVGVERRFGPTSAARGQIGAMVIEDDDEVRLVADAGLDRGWRGGRIALRAGQETGTGGGVTESVSLRQRLHADVSQSLGSRTSASLAVAVTRHVSIVDDPSSPSTRVITYRTSAGITHGLTRRVTVRIAYSYLMQNSDQVGLDGQRHLVTAGVTVSSPPWNLWP